MVIVRSHRWIGGALVGAILGATALAVLAGARHERTEHRDQTSAAARPAVQSLADEISTEAAALDDLRAFLESSDDVSDADFRRFTAAPLARSPALRHLAWTPLDAAGSPAPGMSVGADPVEAHALVASPAAAGALTAARDSARPTMSAPLEDGEGAATLIVAPVYAPGSPVGTVAERRAALRGYVSGRTSARELSADARAGLPEGVSLVVRDQGATLLGPEADVDVQGVIAAAGREWTVGLAGLDGPGRGLPVSLGFAGVGLAAIVGLLFGASATRERQTRTALEGLRVRHDRILAAAADGIVGLDRDARATFVNAAAARMLGWEVDDLVGGRFDELVLPAAGAPARAGREHRGEAPLRRRDGSTFAGEFTVTPIAAGDAEAGAVVVFRDVTDRVRREERTRESLAAAEQMAAVDALTRLANHRTFHERLRVEVARARRRGEPLSLVLMDLDHFKLVNDRHGHQAGDRVLRRAAEVLASQTRTGELVARVGGEEFAMLLPGADGNEAYQAAERVRRAIAAADFPEVGTMTMSAGVCDMTHADDPETLYRLADGALYWAKSSGRDTVLRYAPGEMRPRPDGADTERADRRAALVSMRLLARVVDAKHAGSRRHSERVADLAGDLAAELGWPAARVDALREAALLHDVGKIGVPEELLAAARPLAPDEMALMREHPLIAARVAGEALTPEQVSWVRGHHERWDGTGYPDGLLGADCPEGARILALAEAWDAMTSDRPYPPMPRTPADALAECRAGAGTQFWPPAVAALARLRDDT